MKSTVKIKENRRIFSLCQNRPSTQLIDLSSLAQEAYRPILHVYLSLSCNSVVTVGHLEQYTGV